MENKVTKTVATVTTTKVDPKQSGEGGFLFPVSCASLPTSHSRIPGQSAACYSKRLLGNFPLTKPCQLCAIGPRKERVGLKKKNTLKTKQLNDFKAWGWKDKGQLSSQCNSNTRGYLFCGSWARQHVCAPLDLDHSWVCSRTEAVSRFITGGSPPSEHFKTGLSPLPRSYSSQLSMPSL